MKAGDIYEPKSGNKYVAVNDDETIINICRNCCDCYNDDDDCGEQKHCYQDDIHYKKINQKYLTNEK